MNEHNLFIKYPDCITDRHKLRGVLLDFFPGDRLKSNLIMTAYDAGIVYLIKSAPRLDEKVQLKILEILVNDFGLQESNAKWAVSYWMTNYGVNVLRKTFDSVEMPGINPTNSFDLHNNSESVDSTKLQEAKDKISKMSAKIDSLIKELQIAKEASETAQARALSAETELKKAQENITSLKTELETKKESTVSIETKKDTVASNSSQDSKNNPLTPVQNNFEIQGYISVSEMDDDEKFPKERIVLFPDEYKELGITNFRATAFKLTEFDGHFVVSVKGEYDGKTSQELLIMPMMFNEKNELIAVEFDTGISKRIRSHKTYSIKFRMPNNELVSRIEIKIIKNPVFLN